MKQRDRAEFQCSAFPARWGAPLVWGFLLLAGPLSAQADIPPPGDEPRALAMAAGYYEQAITAVALARTAVDDDDLPSFEAAVRVYRQVMPFVIVWQARACWSLDHREQSVGYPTQAVMGETLVGWTMSNEIMGELALATFRRVTAASLETHGQLLADSLIEMIDRCGPLQPTMAESWPHADPADVESVDSILAALYEVVSGPAGQARDWDRFRSLFIPEARLIPTGRSPAGEHDYNVWSPDEYAVLDGSFLERNGFFGREIHRTEERFGPFVHAFSTYDSKRNVDDPEPFARGINSIQLMHDGDRWYVVTIYLAGERFDLPIPRQYLPSRNGGGGQ